MSRVIAEGKIYETKLNTAKDGRGPGLQLPNRLQLKRWFGDWQNNPKKALRKYQMMSYHPSVLRLMTSLLLCLLKKTVATMIGGLTRMLAVAHPSLLSQPTIYHKMLSMSSILFLRKRN